MLVFYKLLLICGVAASSLESNFVQLEASYEIPEVLMTTSDVSFAEKEKVSNRLFDVPLDENPLLFKTRSAQEYQESDEQGWKTFGDSQTVTSTDNIGRALLTLQNCECTLEDDSDETVCSFTAVNSDCSSNCKGGKSIRIIPTADEVVVQHQRSFIAPTQVAQYSSVGFTKQVSGEIVQQRDMCPYSTGECDYYMIAKCKCTILDSALNKPLCILTVSDNFGNCPSSCPTSRNIEDLSADKTVLPIGQQFSIAPTEAAGCTTLSPTSLS